MPGKTGETAAAVPGKSAFAGMVWIAGGTFSTFFYGKFCVRSRAV
jgi:hypothetical protein